MQTNLQINNLLFFAQSYIEESLNALREELREKKREVESWKDKYLRLLEEYNLHLKDKKA